MLVKLCLGSYFCRVMAFFRVERKKSGSYIRLVETFRQEGKVKHRIIASLGKLEDYSEETLKRLGEKLYLLGGGDLQDLVAKDFSEEKRLNYGFVQAVDKGLKHFGLAPILERIAGQKKLSYSLYDVVRLLLCERLSTPCSKLRSFHQQEDYLGLEPVSLHHIYRSLDYLAQYTKLIQQKIFFTGRNLFNQKLDVVFYDVTTFYFDSEVEDSFREKGFGKDGKIGKTQVVFGLLIDKDKNPIGYRLYSGSQYEGHTFKDAIDSLKQDYQIGQVIVVADSGMLNKDNREAVKPYEFIMGERVKVLPKTVQEAILDVDSYRQEWTTSHRNESIKIRYKEIHVEDRRIIATYSEKRARKDAHLRKEKLQKAQKLLKNPALLEKKASRYFLKKSSANTYILDEEKMEHSARFDGTSAITTNNERLEATLLLDHYKHLFQIEHTFRTFKSHLEVRPMFHWNESRIRGHIALCYIAYSIEHMLLKKLEKAQIKMSEHQLRKALQQMQVSLMSSQKESYYLRSNDQKHHIPQVVQALAFKKLPNFTPKNAIYKYI